MANWQKTAQLMRWKQHPSRSSLRRSLKVNSRLCNDWFSTGQSKQSESRSASHQTMHETKALIAIVSEPNRIPDNDGWHGSGDVTCRLYLASDTEVTRSGQGNGYVWIETTGVRVVSCYHSPSKKYTIDQYKNYVSRIEVSVKQGPADVIVAGDFNAHSPSWASPVLIHVPKRGGATGDGKFAWTNSQE